MNIEFSSLAELGILTTSLNDSLLYAIIAIGIALGSFAISKLIVNKKLGELYGSQKLLGLITIIIGSGLIIYLGTLFGLFTLALEIIAYLGIGLWFILFGLQTHIKNMVSGISNYLNTEMNIGDVLSIEGKKGTLIEFHLTKTVLMSDDGRRIYIPNHKFSEEVKVIYPKSRIQKQFGPLGKVMTQYEINSQENFPLQKTSQRKNEK